MYILKEIPEDFIVEEEIDLPLKDNGNYTYYLLKKREKTTLEAISYISRVWGLGKKQVGFAGNKDKHAITTQYISIYQGPKKNIETEHLSVQYVGRGDEPISLGSNKGNKFVITVRNVMNEPIRQDWFVNYFDEQRFSTHNIAIGRAIVKKNFKEALSLLQKSGREYEKRFEHVLSQQKDYTKALLTTPKKILTLLINAYQSYVWNKTVLLYLKEKEGAFADGFFIPKEKPENVTVPLLGFGTEDIKKPFAVILETILQEEQISGRDFIIKQLPRLSSEGGERELNAHITDLHIGPLLDDTLHEGRKRVFVSFTLKKGAYATMAIRHLFCRESLEK